MRIGQEYIFESVLYSRGKRMWFIVDLQTIHRPRAIVLHSAHLG